MMCLTKAGEENPHVKIFGIIIIFKKDAEKSKLTLIVHTAVLVLLAGHEGINLGLGHLLSCRRTRIHVKNALSISHAVHAKQTIFVRFYIW